MNENLKKLRTFLESAPDGGKLLVSKEDFGMLLGIAESVETGDLSKAMVQFNDILTHYQQRVQRQVESINRLLAAGK